MLGPLIFRKSQLFVKCSKKREGSNTTIYVFWRKYHEEKQ